MPRRTAASEDQLAPFNRYVVAVGAVLFAVLMALSGRYGFHRDELYFLDAGRHLQGGYVDQPIFAPLIARLSIELFGVSLPGLRLWPALAGWTTVVIAGLTARELGGLRRAQLLAAVGTATMPVLMAVDHLEGPTAFDVLAWASLAFVVVRIGRTGRHRLWVPAGVILGVGLTNKHSAAFFAIAFTIGALLSGGWRDVANPWFLIGALVATVFTVPDLVWQARHGWATVTMTRHLNQQNGGAGNIGNFVSGQLLMCTLAFLPVWIAGLRMLWRSDRPLWRGLAWAYVLLFLLFAVTTGAQIYYLGGAYPYLLAAGSLPLDRWLGTRGRRIAVGSAAAAVTAAAAVPIVLPVLPANDIGWTYGVNQAPGESVGWPDLVRQVKTVWDGLPAAQRQDAVIDTVTYGEAGAINELGRGDGLPTAVSGQNNEWWWGPGNPSATTVVMVVPGPRDVGSGYVVYLRHLFRTVRPAATLVNSAGIDNQEWHGHIYVCTGPDQPWGRMWPRFRHYD